MNILGIIFTTPMNLNISFSSKKELTYHYSNISFSLFFIPPRLLIYMREAGFHSRGEGKKLKIEKRNKHVLLQIFHSGIELVLVECTLCRERLTLTQKSVHSGRTARATDITNTFFFTVMACRELVAEYSRRGHSCQTSLHCVCHSLASHHIFPLVELT